MNINKISIITFLLTLLISLCGIYLIGCEEDIKKEEIKKDRSIPLAEVIKEMKPGMVIKINSDEGSRKEERGSLTEARDIYTGARILSPFAISPHEVVAKKQGISLNDKGLNIGQSKGYGILESLWVKIKNGIYLTSIAGVIIFIITGVLMGFGNVIKAILRFVAAVVPFLGSIVEYLIGKKKAESKEKVIKDIVESVDEGFNKAKNVEDIDEETINKIIGVFKYAMATKQDKKTEAEVKKAKENK